MSVRNASLISVRNLYSKLVCKERFIDVCQVHLMQAYLSGMLHRCLSGTLNTISSVRNTSQMSVRNFLSQACLSGTLLRCMEGTHNTSLSVTNASWKEHLTQACLSGTIHRCLLGTKTCLSGVLYVCFSDTSCKLDSQERFTDVCKEHLRQACLSGTLHRCL